MAIFCTKCGTKSEDSTTFCDNCGAAFKAPASAGAPATAPHSSHAQPTTGAYEDTGAASAEKRKGWVTPKKAIYGGVALCGLFAVGATAMYFVLQPPEATRANLLVAAKAGYGKTITEQFKRELCMANMDYSASKFNAGENDRRTLAWLNALVVAGLYSPPVIIESGGYFSRNLLQYDATPELVKFREGTRLCIGKEVEIADVVDIEKPSEQSIGRGAAAKLLMVKAKLTLQATDTAPWLDKPEVRDVVMAQMNGWEYKDKKLQKQVIDTFGLRERQWVTGPAYKAGLEKQYRMGQRTQEDNSRTNNVSQMAGSSNFVSMLSGIFSFGGHPLKGTWRMDTEGMGRNLGFSLPSGLGLDVTMKFTADSIDVGGQSVRCKFEVDGNRVKVTPDGQPTSLIFLMQDKDTATVDMGLFKAQYKRVN